MHRKRKSIVVTFAAKWFTRMMKWCSASNGNSGGMDMMVEDKGVRINFSSRTGMK